MHIDGKCYLLLAFHVAEMQCFCADAATSLHWGANNGKGSKRVALLPSLENLDADAAAKLTPLQDQIKLQVGSIYIVIY